MRVLLIHTYYLQKGGEDKLFEQEHALLSETEQVRTLAFKNKSGIAGALQFLFSIWNLAAARRLKKEIAENRPDVVHLHNTHFAIGPIAIRVAKKAGIPVVLTLHNYRLLCPSATLSINGTLFTDSVNASFPWKAVRKKVYRNSALQTFWLAFIIWFHKKAGTWRMIDKYILLTGFAKSLFIHSSFGVDAERFVIKSNFKDPAADYPARKKGHFLFVGRLSPEKGIKVLLDAFCRSNFELHIAGDGPLKQDVLDAIGSSKKIRLLGNLDKENVELAMKECTALVFPSVWYEGMPMTIIEAFSAGTPVIAGNLGAMASLIIHGYNGLHYEAANADALAKRLNDWQNMTYQEQDAYRRNALNTYDTHYTPEQNKKLLLNIYQNLLYAEGTDQHQH
jgi:glycosyltransferase involved in cell wall biosynthesis